MRTHLHTCMKCLTNLVQNIKLCGLPRTVFKNEDCTQTEIASYFGVSKSTMHRIMKEA